LTGRNGPAIPPCFPGHPPSPYQAPNAAGSRPFRGPADPPRSSFDPSHRLRLGVVGARSTGPLVGPSRALTRRPARSVPVGRRSAGGPLWSLVSSGAAASSSRSPARMTLRRVRFRPGRRRSGSNLGSRGWSPCRCGRSCAPASAKGGRHSVPRNHRCHREGSLWSPRTPWEGLSSSHGAMLRYTRLRPGATGLGVVSSTRDAF